MLVILVLIAITTAQQSTHVVHHGGLGGVFSTDWDPANNKFGALAVHLRHAHHVG